MNALTQSALDMLERIRREIESEQVEVRMLSRTPYQSENELTLTYTIEVTVRTENPDTL